MGEPKEAQEAPEVWGQAVPSPQGLAAAGAVRVQPEVEEEAEGLLHRHSLEQRNWMVLLEEEEVQEVLLSSSASSGPAAQPVRDPWLLGVTKISLQGPGWVVGAR